MSPPGSECTPFPSDPCGVAMGNWTSGIGRERRTQAERKAVPGSGRVAGGWGPSNKTTV